MFHTRIKEIYALCIKKAFIFIKIQQYSIFFALNIEKNEKSGILNLKIVTNIKEGKGKTLC